MADQEYSEQQELQLAIARDNDDKDLMALLISIILLRRAQKINRELTAEIKKKERRLLYHEPRKYAPRVSIAIPAESPWTQMMNCGNESDGLWVIWTGLSKQSFMQMRDLCHQHWEANPIRAFRTDRPNGRTGNPRPQDIARRLLDCTGTMAITLKFLTSKSEVVDIGNQFGLTLSEAQKYIDFGVDILIAVLIDHPNSSIHWPVDSQEYLEEMRHLLRLYVPELQNYDVNVVGFLDAVRFQIANKWGLPMKRKLDQSGEKKMTLRKCTLISDPRGYVVAAVINTPGSWGDGKACRLGGLYDLVDTLPEGYCIAADTAFRGNIVGSKIVKILKEGQIIPEELPPALLPDLERRVTTSRQPGEWINRDFVKEFSRLRSILGVRDDINQKRMLAAILVHNWRVSTMDRCQVKKFFQILYHEAEQVAN